MTKQKYVLEDKLNSTLLNARKKLGVSVSQAAKLIGISSKLYNKCEKGLYPAIRYQEKICEFYESDIQDIFPEPNMVFLSQMDQRILPVYDFLKVIEKDTGLEKMNECMESLKPVQKKVLEMRYALNGHDHAYVLSEIGKEINRCRETVRQIEKKALKRLRVEIRQVL